MDLHPSEFGPESQIYLDAFLECIGRPCDEATIVAASPISHVDPSDAPILLANGTADILVPPVQAVRMADALERAGVGHELAIIPDAGNDERVVMSVEQPSGSCDVSSATSSPGHPEVSASAEAAAAVSSRR